MTGDMVRGRAGILTVIAVGGALGSLGRWALGEALPHRPNALPWSTAVANVSGAFALGLLMVLVIDVWPSRRYLRPFAATGLLGGYTTFSTYMLDTRALLDGGQFARAGLYLFGTLLTGLVAVWLGMVSARALLAWGRRRRRRRDTAASVKSEERHDLAR